MSKKDRYPVLAQRFRAEEVIQKSRFLTTVTPVDSIAEAQEFIAEVSAEFPDANHNCWAYLVGPPGSSGRIGMSDDGEPHGTAGRPMLNVLLHAEVGDVAAVVTRCFGGIKLGKGGLVRAYGGCLSNALSQAPTQQKISWYPAQLKMGYELKESIQHLYPSYGVELLEEVFSEFISHQLRIPESEVEAFRIALRDATRGKVTLPDRED